MRLKSLSARNFLSAGNAPISVSFDDSLTTVVGPNGAGKTSIFRAIGFVSDIFNNRTSRQNFEEFIKPYYHRGNNKDPIEIEIGVQLSDEEINALVDFLICSCLLIVSQHDRDENKRKLEKELVVRYGKELFKELFKNVAVIVKVYRKRDYPTVSAIKISGNNSDFYIHLYGSITNSSSRPRTRQLFSLVDVLLDDLTDKYSGETRDYTEGRTDLLPFENYYPANIFISIGRKIDDDTPTSIDIQGVNFLDVESRVGGKLDIADLQESHTLAQFLRSRGYSEDQVNIFDVFSIIYDSSIARIANTRCMPEGILLENGIPETFDAREFTGNDLPALLFRLKNSIDSDERGSYSAITKEFENMTGYQFEVFLRDEKISRSEYESELISPSEIGGHTIGTIPMTRRDVKLYGIKEETKNVTVHELTICFIKDKMVIPLEFAASGLFEILYLLTLIAGVRNHVLLLDEPALNLHPNMQRRILDIIQKRSVVQNGNQTILITHSPYMIDVHNPENVLRFSLTNDGSTRVVTLGETLGKLDPDDQKQLAKYLTNIEVRSLLFSRGMVLTEGPSDRIVLQLADRYLSSIGKGANLEEKEWVITDVGGKDSFRILFSLAKELDIRYAAVMDFDALMKCERMIKNANIEVRTSSIFYGLYHTSILNEQECLELEGLHKEGYITTVEDDAGKKVLWYKQDPAVKDNLRGMALKHYIFVFMKDLEGALQMPKIPKKRKPLKSVDAMLEAIEHGKIPEEFYSLTELLNEWSKDQNSKAQSSV